jgi:hypothetical protein
MEKRHKDKGKWVRRMKEEGGRKGWERTKEKEKRRWAGKEMSSS